MDKINGLMPGLGFGTYGRTGPDGIEAIRFALECGYRHLDTAQSYDTEKEVGEAIRLSGVARGDVFVTTKIQPPNFGKAKLIPSLEASLENLGMDYVDLTLIHWPSPGNEIALPIYLEQLAKAQQRGLTRSIGVSNFTIALIEQAISLLGEASILTNQMELNPLFKNEKLAKYCGEAGIAITCYQPLAEGKVLADPILQTVAGRHGVTASQIALAWELAMGYAAIPTSGNKERIADNFAASTLRLTPQDMAEIAHIEAQPRAIDPDWGPEWD